MERQERARVRAYNNKVLIKAGSSSNHCQTFEKILLLENVGERWRTLEKAAPSPGERW
jgi:hypothetical protein